MDEALLRILTPTVVGDPRPSRSRLRGGRGCRAGRPGRGRASVAGRACRGILLAGCCWSPWPGASSSTPPAPIHSRRHREGRVEGEPGPGPGEVADDTLQPVLPVRAPVPDPGLGRRAHAACGRRPDHASDRAHGPTWCRRRPWPSGSAGPSGPSHRSSSTGPVTSPRCCACSTWSSTRATPADVDLRRRGDRPDPPVGCHDQP